MNFHVTFADVVKRLDENKLSYKVVRLANGMRMIALVRGGRFLGPFEGDEGESFLWLNEVWKDPEQFRSFLGEDRYNVGGERLWIAPEFAFFTREKKRFDDTYVVQKAMDPGGYCMKKSEEDSVSFEMKTECEAFEMPFESKKFFVEKGMRSVENPLKYLHDYESVMEGVTYCGYEQFAAVKDCSPENEMYLEPWFLTQVNPGGVIVVPFFGPFEFEDYYEPITEKYQKVRDRYVCLKITGDRKYKTAYKSAVTFGRAAYLNRLEDGRYYILIRNYLNDPSIPYCSEPWKRLGRRGCSLYVYNDSGEGGGFAEFENSGLTIGLDSGRSESVSYVTEWFFVGARPNVMDIANRMLGVACEGEMI